MSSPSPMVPQRDRPKESVCTINLGTGRSSGQNSLQALGAVCWRFAQFVRNNQQQI